MERNGGFGANANEREGRDMMRLLMERIPTVEKADNLTKGRVCVTKRVGKQNMRGQRHVATKEPKGEKERDGRTGPAH